MASEPATSTTTTTTTSISSYVELAGHLDDTWQELTFDLATSSGLQDVVVPETAGGYVYRDANVAGSATHNRFIYWQISADTLKLVEISTEFVLDGNQVRIKFTNSPVISDVTVLESEQSESVTLMIATMTSVHRLHLPHPKVTNKSILSDLTADVLYNRSNYYILSDQISVDSKQPICAASWHDKPLLKCALSFPDGSILIVQFGESTHHLSACEIRQASIIGRLWSRMPNLLARHPNDCDNAIFICIPQAVPNDVLLFTLCRDCKVRVFSTRDRDLIYTYNLIPQSSFSSQSFASHLNLTTEQPMMKLLDSNLVVYMSENEQKFIILSYNYDDGSLSLIEKASFQAAAWEKLIDFNLSRSQVWALAYVRETDPALFHFRSQRLLEEDDTGDYELEGVWEAVTLIDDLSTPKIRSYEEIVTEIFWRNRFSKATIRKGLSGLIGESIPEYLDLKSLESVAHTKIIDKSREDETWSDFYEYCLQSQHAANRPFALVVGADETIISIIKRSNLSFISPWLKSVDSEQGPYRGIEYSPDLCGLIEPLNYVSSSLVDDDVDNVLLEQPAFILNAIDNVADNIISTKKISLSKLNFARKSAVASAIDYIREQLDLSDSANEYQTKILDQLSSRVRSSDQPLRSNCGILTTFQLFRHMVQARMTLSRDLLIYISLARKLADTDRTATKNLGNLFKTTLSSQNIGLIVDSLRAYALLYWISDSPIKSPTVYTNREPVAHIAKRLRFFSELPDSSGEGSIMAHEDVTKQNLFMYFLADGGANFSSLLGDKSSLSQTMSSSFYVTDIVFNLCKLIWPRVPRLCFVEFLLTRQLGEHLEKYLDFLEGWLIYSETDRQFLRAINSMAQGRPSKAVEIFNRLWHQIHGSDTLKSFLELDEEKQATSHDEPPSSAVITHYYDRLVELFELTNDHQSLVNLINNGVALLEAGPEDEQLEINRFQAKLFQFYLELDQSDDAYHTMVLMSDSALQINCLRRFIVSHCEKGLYSHLLSYPFIDIKEDFIDILNQKAESSDLSKIDEFNKTSYYDLLFSSYASEDEFKLATEVMYNYSQRLAQEVPGIDSIRKQADCLLIALMTLRCVDDKEAFIEIGTTAPKCFGLKRNHEGEASFNTSRFDLPEGETITRGEIKKKYELTAARLKLLEKDQNANAIALSPLKPEEVITQLVASSMFSTAMDLALLFKTPMDPILEGLAAKYIFISRLSPVDIAVHQDLECGLSDIFTDSYSNIGTYNYIANATVPLVEKLWRLIDHYLNTYDGFSHRYSRSLDTGNTYTGSTPLMKTVAAKLLSAGCDIPATLKRMYLARFPAELLKLLMKYDKLVDATELAIEIINRVLEPANCLAFNGPFSANEPPPIYLPTHLILELISFLREDATDIVLAKLSDQLADKLADFRNFVKSCL